MYSHDSTFVEFYVHMIIMGVFATLYKKNWMERLPNIFVSFFLLCWIACIFPFCFIINSHNENPLKVYTRHQDTVSVSLPALFLKALDYVKNILLEKTSMETSVIKVLKVDFISPVTTLRPYPMSGSGFSLWIHLSERDRGKFNHILG